MYIAIALVIILLVFWYYSTSANDSTNSMVPAAFANLIKRNK